MTKHTPGPWKVHGYANTNYASFSIKGPDERGVCAIASSIKRPGTESMVNAQLIAAAPEMFEVLTEYLVFNGDYASSMPDDAWVEKVRVAIAKAKGETP